MPKYHATPAGADLSPEQARVMVELHRSRTSAVKARGDAYIQLLEAQGKKQTARTKALESQTNVLAELADIEAADAPVQAARVRAATEVMKNQQDLLERSMKETEDVPPEWERHLADAQEAYDQAGGSTANKQAAAWLYLLDKGIVGSNVAVIRQARDRFGYGNPTAEDGIGEPWAGLDSQFFVIGDLIADADLQYEVLIETRGDLQVMTQRFEDLLAGGGDVDWNAEIAEQRALINANSQKLFEGIDVELGPEELAQLAPFDQQVLEIDERLAQIQPTQETDPWVQRANQILEDEDFQRWAEGQGYDLNNPLDQDRAIFTAIAISDPEFETNRAQRRALGNAQLVTISFPGAPTQVDPGARGAELVEGDPRLGQPQVVNGFVVEPKFDDPPGTIRILLPNGQEELYNLDEVDVEEQPKLAEDISRASLRRGRRVGEAIEDVEALDPLDVEVGRREARGVVSTDDPALQELDEQPGLGERFVSRRRQALAERQERAGKEPSLERRLDDPGFGEDIVAPEPAPEPAPPLPDEETTFTVTPNDPRYPALFQQFTGREYEVGDRVLNDPDAPYAQGEVTVEGVGYTLGPDGSITVRRPKTDEELVLGDDPRYAEDSGLRPGRSALLPHPTDEQLFAAQAERGRDMVRQQAARARALQSARSPDRRMFKAQIQEGSTATGAIPIDPNDPGIFGDVQPGERTDRYRPAAPSMEQPDDPKASEDAVVPVERTTKRRRSRRRDALAFMDQAASR
jgi:hypothetical protein